MISDIYIAVFVMLIIAGGIVAITIFGIILKTRLDIDFILDVLFSFKYMPALFAISIIYTFLSFIIYKMDRLIKEGTTRIDMHYYFIADIYTHPILGGSQFAFASMLFVTLILAVFSNLFSSSR